MLARRSRSRRKVEERCPVGMLGSQNVKQAVAGMRDEGVNLKYTQMDRPALVLSGVDPPGCPD